MRKSNLIPIIDSIRCNDETVKEKLPRTVKTRIVHKLSTITAGNCDDFLTPNQVAQLRKTTEATLKVERWRRVNNKAGFKGSPFYKVGHAVRYKLKDILELMETIKVI